MIVLREAPGQRSVRSAWLLLSELPCVCLQILKARHLLPCGSPPVGFLPRCLQALDQAFGPLAVQVAVDRVFCPSPVVRREEESDLQLVCHPECDLGRRKGLGRGIQYHLANSFFDLAIAALPRAHRLDLAGVQ